jgi:flagellin-like hook-associated protein FlgL
MITSLNPSSQRFLSDLSRIQTQLDRAQAKISSGFKVQTASDAPDQIGQLLQLESQFSANTQDGSNLNAVKVQIDSGESALNGAVQSLDQAVALAVQGANSTTSAATRLSLADQVKGLQEQFVRTAGLTVQGLYIFGGDQDTQAPYQLNLANANGVDRLTTTTASRQIQSSSGSSFTAAHTAQDIFDHRNADDTLAPDNVFAALNSLRVALTNNDASGITAAITSLQTSSTYLNGQLAFYGGAQNSVAAAITVQQSSDTSLRAQIGNIRDADVTQAILELTQGNNQQQAALASEAKISKNSLFNYLA